MGLTDILAIYGAGLSTATAFWGYYRTRPQVRVLLVHAFDHVGGEPKTGVTISVQNVSAQPVHIIRVSLLYPFARATFLGRLERFVRSGRVPRNVGWCHCLLLLHGVEDGCPVSIEPGKSHQIFVRHEVLDEVLEDAQSRRLKALAQDAIWRNTYSKAFEYLALE